MRPVNVGHRFPGQSLDQWVEAALREIEAAANEESLLSAANTWAAPQTFSGDVTFSGAVNGIVQGWTPTAPDKYLYSDGVGSVVEGDITAAGRNLLDDDDSSAQRETLGLTNPSFRNRVINGNFAVNQRAVSGTVSLSAGAYGHDRWKAGAGGCSYTFTTSGLDTTITITSGTLCQVIEGSFVEGGVYRASWSGTAQARVYQGSPAGAYAASPFTTGSLTAATDTTIEFGTGTVTRVQVEPGSVATAFERRDDELHRCWSYYWRWTTPALYTPIGVGVVFSPTIVLAVTRFPAPMRAAPAGVAVSSWSHLQIVTGGAALTPSAVSIDGADRYGASLNWTVTGATAGQAALVRSASTSATVSFDAEL